MESIQQTCCFTGHRPEKCLGSEAKIRRQLAERITQAIQDGYTVFLSGMALGVDTWAAEEVLNRKAEQKELKLICVVPYEGLEKERTPEGQTSYFDILRCADDVVFMSKEYTPQCFHQRDEYMVDHASRVIAVFNGTPGGTEYTIRYAEILGRTVDLIMDES